MGRIRIAAVDAGPLIHLDQAGGRRVFRVIRRACVTTEVRRELGPAFDLPATCEVAALNAPSRDLTKLLSERYSLGSGEASCIALARQERIRLFFTDDLEAREVAAHLGLEPHGSLALVTRAYREGLLERAEALAVLESLHERSTLYLTSELLHWARRQILEFAP